MSRRCLVPGRGLSGHWLGIASCVLSTSLVGHEERKLFFGFVKVDCCLLRLSFSPRDAFTLSSVADCSNDIHVTGDSKIKRYSSYTW